MSAATQVIKTLANSWASSYRYHEKIKLPCLFGCTHGIDSLQHYTSCPTLREVSMDIFGHLFEVGPFPDIFCTNVQSVTAAKCCACIYSGYHAVRRDDQVVSVSTCSLSSDVRTVSIRERGREIHSGTVKINAERAAGTFSAAARAEAFRTMKGVSLYPRSHTQTQTQSSASSSSIARRVFGPSPAISVDEGMPAAPLSGAVASSAPDGPRS